MGKAFKIVFYDVVETDDEITVIRDLKTKKVAQVRTDWLAIKEGTARAVSNTKQVRIDALNWK